MRLSMDTTNNVGVNDSVSESIVPVIVDEPSAEWEATRMAEYEAELQVVADREKARKSAFSKLKALGLTEAEIATIITG